MWAEYNFFKKDLWKCRPQSELWKEILFTKSKWEKWTMKENWDWKLSVSISPLIILQKLEITGEFRALRSFELRIQPFVWNTERDNFPKIKCSTNLNSYKILHKFRKVAIENLRVCTVICTRKPKWKVPPGEREPFFLGFASLGRTHSQSLHERHVISHNKIWSGFKNSLV